MDEYKKLINQLFDDLDEIDGDREDFEKALALLYFKSKERLEIEGIDPNDYLDVED